MADDSPAPPPSTEVTRRDITRALDPDYEAIYAAVTETARGRWFLDEYAKRNRTADTGALLVALRRLERLIAGQRGTSIEAVRLEVEGLAELVKRARTEISVISNPDDDPPQRRDADEIDFAVEAEAGKAAVAAARRAGERIQEVVWNLREQGVSPELCGVLDRHAIEVLGSADRETATLKGMSAMGRALRQIDERVTALLGTFSSADHEDDDSLSSVIQAVDPAIGRFLEDIEMVDVEDVAWEAHQSEFDDPDDEFESPESSDDAAVDGASSAADSLGEVPEPERASEVQAADSSPTPDSPAPSSQDVEFGDEELFAEPAELDALARESVEAGDPEAVVPLDEPANADVAAAPKSIAKQPASARVPPADLTGLTFDQKMVLFS